MGPSLKTAKDMSNFISVKFVKEKPQNYRELNMFVYDHNGLNLI
jgi:hypothetical protein